ncbi:hypothetical protein SODALDRAFT_320283 [Sodiomyces alkalinus F11]|uniref:C2H2-type domain-containing protein n=1 Tax=Sodiomyces alkalinus (strain CBS 110278 / VKM F-3762 / F11) TaxID=1314773 RepID=A0A3N2PML5_SODAK|nr:hypothetical protein SODALDRAFT_320283 [Sodiomyces alkalinus F11]ROT35772.1 hypothetical protein SODALDRAFT_320283 [Sodiomyces alkalinus F11]
MAAAGFIPSVMAVYDDASTTMTATPTSSSSEEGSSIGWNSPAATTAARELKYECTWNQCGKMFRRRSDLTKHERYHVKDSFCDEPGCDKAFATQKDLKRHKKTHEKVDDSGAAPKGYRCRVPGCRKAKTGHVYNRRDNFVRHLRTKHVGLDLDAEEFGSG